MNFIVIGRDHPEFGPERRKQHRPAHLENAREMADNGKLIFATALLEADQMIGSVMIFEFENENELEMWKKVEPYIIGDVWSSIEIKPCAIPPLFQSS